MTDATCGTCVHYHQFKAGEHILGPGDLNAGDCWHPWMARAYRAADDGPVFGDCWVEREVE